MRTANCFDKDGNVIAIGDTVEFYDYTYCINKTGVVTEVNCPILWAHPDVKGVRIGEGMGITRPFNDIRKV
jgi:hypothetical protein